MNVLIILLVSINLIFLLWIVIIGKEVGREGMKEEIEELKNRVERIDNIKLDSKFHYWYSKKGKLIYENWIYLPALIRVLLDYLDIGIEETESKLILKKINKRR